MNSDIFSLVKDQNNYLKSIEADFQNKEIKRSLIQHIAIGYLRGLEKLKSKDSLFNIVLKKWNDEEIREIISFFYFIKNIHIEKELKIKVLDFWKYCFNKLDKKTTFTDVDKSILSDLNLLACFLDKINEEKQWLLQSVQYVGLNYNSSEFIKCLIKLADDNTVEVYEVFKFMLSYFIPTDSDENVISIIKKIADKLNKKSAGEIVDIYLTRGFKFARNII